MNEEQKITDFLMKHKGPYTFKSPYHKNKKLLPFTITGRSYDPNFPIAVNTVVYRGWEKSNISDAYTLCSLEALIKTGFLKAVTDGK